MSPSGAVRAGPPAAQANRTANFNAHEYSFILTGVDYLLGLTDVRGAYPGTAHERYPTADNIESALYPPPCTHRISQMGG